jgi:sulfide:quinone oxidoreductase
MAAKHEIVIIGGGAAGLATAASLHKRNRGLDIAIIEPAENHYYQPGWTMVGSGVFDKEFTQRSMDSIWPSYVKRIKGAVKSFERQLDQVTLENGDRVHYNYLIIAPGLKLDWAAVEGLEDALGRNGVTSNYRYDLAPYTWKLTQELKSGEAIFTQPPMPIKCAGAPQKAMYLSSDHWLKNKVLDNINVSFCNAGPVLFGCEPYVAPLMEYVEKYGIQLDFSHNLVKIDGDSQTAWFKATDGDGKVSEVKREFDMIHVCPPQCALDFIKQSPMANEGGWIDVDQYTLQHSKFDNIFSLGDACSAPNAKTAAAVRKQAPIVAQNLLAVMAGKAPKPLYQGYGSCPLTVENGKIILAEFGYGGKLMSTFPWDSTKPRGFNWYLKKNILPKVYWDWMFKAKEWFV